MAAISTCKLKIGVNGTEHVVTEIKLYPETEVRWWQSKITQAQEELGGFSTGVGIFGSPGVALAGAAAIGIIEAAVSSSKVKGGLRLLREASELLDEIRSIGVYVPVDSICGVDEAIPSKWSASGPGQQTIYLEALGIWNRTKAESMISKEEKKAGSFQRPGNINRVALEDEFVWFRSADNELAVRWSAVQSYSLLKAANPSEKAQKNQKPASSNARQKEQIGAAAAEAVSSAKRPSDIATAPSRMGPVDQALRDIFARCGGPSVFDADAHPAIPKAVLADLMRSGYIDHDRMTNRHSLTRKGLERHNAIPTTIEELEPPEAGKVETRF